MISASTPVRLPRGLARRTSARTRQPLFARAIATAEPTKPVLPVINTVSDEVNSFSATAKADYERKHGAFALYCCEVNTPEELHRGKPRKIQDDRRACARGRALARRRRSRVRHPGDPEPRDHRCTAR